MTKQELRNRIEMQINLLTISGKDKKQTIDHLVEIGVDYAGDGKGDASVDFTMQGFKINVIENNIAAQDGKALLILSSKDYKEYQEKIRSSANG